MANPLNEPTAALFWATFIAHACEGRRQVTEAILAEGCPPETVPSVLATIDQGVFASIGSGMTTFRIQ